MRNHNEEYRDNDSRKYSYDFDGVIRGYLLRTLQPYFRFGGSALELGCYKGDMTGQILEYFDSVTVVEAASELAEFVRRRFSGKVTVVADRLESVRIDAKYDNVFLIHTLEHLDDPVAILRRVLDWLTPEGRLFVAVPNATALSRQLAVKMGLVDYHAAVTGAEREHGHRRTYSLDVLLAHLREAGCRIEDYGGILVKPMANFQFDQAIAHGIVDTAYLDACNELAKTHPDLSASLYSVCSRSRAGG
jgi:2-polyprenyl-3-methyl-5-hydroxy-6-metoxy-1,4-benzoquinol methylase